MSDIDCKFPQDADLQPKCEIETDFMLNTESIFKEIRKLNYKQIKCKIFFLSFTCSKFTWINFMLFSAKLP